MLVAAYLSMDTQPFTTSPGSPIPPWAFGLIAFGIIVLLLCVTFAFKSIGKRH